MNMGVPMEIIRRVVKRFEAVEHRIEFVTERFGVKYYNDSKGTNPDAAMQRSSHAGAHASHRRRL